LAVQIRVLVEPSESQFKILGVGVVKINLKNKKIVAQKNLFRTI